MLLTNGTHPYHPTTLLLSLDGLRADYLSPERTPHLYNLSLTGLSPKYMLPSFPSVTFPNHYTLATGFLPAHHGIVGNTFYSPDADASFHYTSPSHSLQNHWWTQNPKVSPIWRTVERAGGKAAVHMWPGSEVSGLGATYIDKYNGSATLESKIESLVNWLDLPLDQRPQLIAGYVPNVDAAGHRFGPEAEETRKALSAVDTAIGDLATAIAARNLTDIVSLVIVSDHGMAATSRDRLIHLDSLVDISKIEHFEGWPLYGLRPKQGEDATGIYESIQTKHKEGDPWDVYTISTLPERYKFTDNNRIAPIWIVPKVGWAIVLPSEVPKPGEEYSPKGIHGYDNLEEQMRAIFIASGGKFHSVRESGKNLKVFQNTEVYGIVGETLGLNVEVRGKGDASVESISELLVEEKPAKENPKPESKTSIKTAGDTPHTSVPQPSTTVSATARPTISTTAAADPADETEESHIGVDEPVEGGKVGVDEPEDVGEDTRSWWELLKEKARKAKERVQGWWETAWSEGEKPQKDAEKEQAQEKPE